MTPGGQCWLLGDARCRVQLREAAGTRVSPGNTHGAAEICPTILQDGPRIAPNSSRATDAAEAA